MSISSVSAASQITTSTNAASVMKSNGTSENIPDRKEDRVELGLLSSASSLMTPDVPNNNPGAIRIGDIQTQMNIDKQRVDDELDVFMTSLGIEKDVSFSLTTTRTGRIAVSGDFEGKERLETALNNDKEFNNNFKRLSANSSLMEAVKRSEEFQKAYEIDPKAAVAQFASLLSDSTEYHFSYLYENGQSETNVNVVSRGTYSV